MRLSVYRLLFASKRRLSRSKVRAWVIIFSQSFSLYSGSHCYSCVVSNRFSVRCVSRGRCCHVAHVIAPHTAIWQQWHCLNMRLPGHYFSFPTLFLPIPSPFPAQFSSCQKEHVAVTLPEPTRVISTVACTLALPLNWPHTNMTTQIVAHEEPAQVS